MKRKDTGSGVIVAAAFVAAVGIVAVIVAVRAGAAPALTPGKPKPGAGRWRLLDPDSQDDTRSYFTIPQGTRYAIVSVNTPDYRMALMGLRGQPGAADYQFIDAGQPLPPDWPSDDYWGPGFIRATATAAGSPVKLAGAYGVWVRET